MNLPLIGNIDFKSLIIGVLIAYFVIPFVMSKLSGPTTSRTNP